MKYSVLFIFMISLLAGCESKKDSVEQANEQNQNAAIDEKISKFLTGAADARMMGIEEGKLAKAKARSPQLKQYGEWMVTENNRLLKELRLLAASKNIVLPSTLSKKNTKNLENLREEEGEDFDDKLVKIMRKDHKNDVDEFEDAEDFKDKDVRQFAVTYRPVVESYLTRLKQIEENDRQPRAAGDIE
jgi:putative membrane protein